MKIAYEKRKSLYGYGFIALWLVGTVLFFIVPLIKSFTYSFRDIERNVFGGFVGLDNYKQAFLGDEVYAERLVSVLKTTAMKTPLILIFALFVAVMLNQIVDDITLIVALWSDNFHGATSQFILQNNAEV